MEGEREERSAGREAENEGRRREFLVFYYITFGYDWWRFSGGGWAKLLLHIGQHVAPLKKGGNG